MRKSGEGTIIAVDLLRFACALLVLGNHFGIVFWASPSPHSALVLAGVPWRFDGSALARVGWIGVELFFVISGLVIARSAVGLRWTEFLWKRTLRLAPAAWICATITLSVLLASGRFALPGLLDSWWRSIRFWPAGEQIDASYWTLGIEVAFYLLMAFAAANRGSARRVEAIGIALGAASGAFWLWWLWVGQSPDLLRNTTMTLSLLPHGCFFAIGVLIAGVARDGATRWRSIVLASLMPVAAIEIAAHAAERTEAVGVTASVTLAELLFFGGVAVLIAASRLQPLLARWIAPGVARTVGLMTYPLYLLHQDAGAVLLGTLAGAGMPPRLAAGLSAAVILTIAWLVALSLEPMLRGLLAAAPAAVSRFRALGRDTRPSASPPVG
jgi:peptidoglycan/LPS O-acetylase OafA/YrhL